VLVGAFLHHVELASDRLLLWEKERGDRDCPQTTLVCSLELTTLGIRNKVDVMVLPVRWFGGSQRHLHEWCWYCDLHGQLRGTRAWDLSMMLMALFG